MHLSAAICLNKIDLVELFKQSNLYRIFHIKAHSNKSPLAYIRRRLIFGDRIYREQENKFSYFKHISPISLKISHNKSKKIEQI